jgi:hypothetical protein
MPHSQGTLVLAKRQINGKSRKKARLHFINHPSRKFTGYKSDARSEAVNARGRAFSCFSRRKLSAQLSSPPQGSARGATVQYRHADVLDVIHVTECIIGPLITPPGPIAVRFGNVTQ